MMHLNAENEQLVETDNGSEIVTVVPVLSVFEHVPKRRVDVGVTVVVRRVVPKI